MDQTKLRILSAAAKLFDIHGYHGTSVRQIAEEARVNVALISYHFRGKQGVLETLIASYFETLFRLLENREKEDSGLPSMERLERVIRLYLSFQREHAPITRLIQRELSVESMLAREVMTLYLSRWKHGIANVIEEGIAAGEFRAVPVDRIALATASQLIYPFLQPQSVREVYYLEPASEEFAEWLLVSVMRYLEAWLLPARG
ncbi:forespore capture DNA-binding protein RefZ [Brevibacillus thermoruber]|jgi:AcrR family transcriptional regulator|uniref:forespore capture DNA-binding protein RefZ n=1 Tax=Brevibacillus TaxID=55080 RepID=UPI0005585F32|nr:MULTISPECIES: forespore capture DNA-binding protein RefZ [Brevibacillus]UYZ14637.1 forespore capture DNA-binding protein RefZ [Brevibacillus sp. WF146]